MDSCLISFSNHECGSHAISFFFSPSSLPHLSSHTTVAMDGCPSSIHLVAPYQSKSELTRLIHHHHRALSPAGQLSRPPAMGIIYRLHRQSVASRRHASPSQRRHPQFCLYYFLFALILLLVFFIVVYFVATTRKRSRGDRAYLGQPIAITRSCISRSRQNSPCNVFCASRLLLRHTGHIHVRTLHTTLII